MPFNRAHSLISGSDTPQANWNFSEPQQPTLAQHHRRNAHGIGNETQWLQVQLYARVWLHNGSGQVAHSQVHSVIKRHNLQKKTNSLYILLDCLYQKATVIHSCKTINERLFLRQQSCW